ncbi:hypothetical protein BDV98DRAFT_107057 [Pterulicium gracile]|uniref:Uncharacterized protein n=1 Tax=Pterulicium gracile TaxID=1884261 RepID=A0A5C3QEY9_9AGAR|nr:hypothetical protein BDV98DRAFT_107057 [Pterula gracilis]
MSAPLLDLPATPANEWAANTTQAIQSSDPTPSPPIPVVANLVPATALSDTNNTATNNVANNALSTAQPDVQVRHPSIPHFASTMSTPGPELPGAYPRGEQNEHDVNVTREGLEHSTQAVVENVTGMLETAKQYLPQAVTSYFPAVAPKADQINAETTLPSAEVHGDTSGTSRGVGGLPGDVNESAVAKLPEERALDGTIKDTTPVASDDTPAIQTTTNTLAHLNLQDASGGPSQVDGSRAHPDSTTDKFPSSVPGAGGVGDLPDTASETSLPVLFEERHLHDTTSTKSTGITAGGVGAITTGGVGDLPGTKSESSVAKLPEERLHEKTPIAETSKPLPPIATSNVTHSQSRQPPSSVLSTTAVVGHTPDETPTSTKQDIGHGPSPLHNTVRTFPIILEPPINRRRV